METSVTKKIIGSEQQVSTISSAAFNLAMIGRTG